MKGIMICNKGIEEIAKREIKELIKSGGKISDSVVIFNFANLEDIGKLIYKSQSASKILFLISNFKFTNLTGIKNKVKKIDFNKYIDNKKYRVDCQRIGEHDFNSIDIEKEIYRIVKGKIDYDAPQVIISVFINHDNLYLGIDYAGFDLSKRDYRIFLHPAEIKATLAYAMLRLADYKKSEILLDPFCGSGTICIEGVFFSNNFPVRYYEKGKFIFLKINFEKIDKQIKINKKISILGFSSLFANIKAAQKNAKIAGVQKQIRLSRTDLDFIDIKFDKNSVDKIVTNPPQPSKSKDEKVIEKIYNEFFYQCEYVLKKNGKIATIGSNTELIEKIAAKNKFKVKNKMEVWQGKEKKNIVVFSR